MESLGTNISLNPGFLLLHFKVPVQTGQASVLLQICFVMGSVWQPKYQFSCQLPSDFMQNNLNIGGSHESINSEMFMNTPRTDYCRVKKATEHCCATVTPWPVPRACFYAAVSESLAMVS